MANYPRLSAYLLRVLEMRGVAETVDLGHIKQGYCSIGALNPNGIVPLGPELSFGRRDAGALFV